MQASYPALSPKSLKTEKRRLKRRSFARRRFGKQRRSGGSSTKSLKKRGKTCGKASEIR